MEKDFSCDYLLGITGLLDNGENLYSCCHPSGVMCGKEDCPVVIDFARGQTGYMGENPTATIFRGMNDYGAEANDYDSLTRGKLCPLKTAEPPILVFWNLEPDPGLAARLKAGVIKCLANGEPPRVEYISGRCGGSRCAWWDADRERCAVLSIARDK